MGERQANARTAVVRGFASRTFFRALAEQRTTRHPFGVSLAEDEEDGTAEAECGRNHEVFENQPQCLEVLVVGGV